MTAAIGAAAEKGVATKVAASQATSEAASSTAAAGAKSAKKAAGRDRTIQKDRDELNLRRSRDPKTSGPGSPKKKASTSPKKPAAQRAADRGKTAAKQRAESAKQSHQKTKSSVESKYRRDKVMGLAEMRPKTRMLAAEYMAAIVMAVIMLFLHNDNEEENTYTKRMTRFFIQMTGITGIFFVLALVASSEKAARYAIPFGLLIDVSMLIYLFNQGGGNAIAAMTGGYVPTDYAEILHNEETAHGSPPTIIAPGLIVTPGNVGVIGGNLGGPVQNPGMIQTPGNKKVFTPPGGVN